MEPYVLSTDHDDGSVDFTLSFAEEDHRFSASTDGDEAIVEYEETLSWRGQIRVREPDEDVYKMLMQSDKMTEFLEANGLQSVKRKREVH